MESIGDKNSTAGKKKIETAAVAVVDAGRALDLSKTGSSAALTVTGEPLPKLAKIENEGQSGPPIAIPQVDKWSQVKIPSQFAKRQFNTLDEETQFKIKAAKFEQFCPDFEKFYENNADCLELYGLPREMLSCVFCTHYGIRIKRNKTGDFYNFFSRDGLKSHWRSYHNAQEICEFCGDGFDDKFKLLGHLTKRRTSCAKKYVEKRAAALEEFKS